ncbi:O-antigen ligase family protein, partial [Candidatus Falkowbacteria bacterium]|nr:O-antigen ligase family protein [Candidatus Falkowbacteria bacterium]
MVNNITATRFNNLIKEKISLYNLVAFIYLAGIIILSIMFGLSPLLYFLFAIIAAVLIIPSYPIGFKLIIIMTMIFERFFTLQSLVMEQQIYKLYPLDMVIGLTILGWLISFFRPQAEKDRPKIIWEAPEKILFIFLIISVFYYIRANLDVNADLEVAFSTFKNYTFYPLLYFLTVYSVQNIKIFKNTVQLIFIGGVLIIGFIAAGFFLGQGLWTEFTPLSTAGVRFLAGTHGFYLTVSTIITISLLSFKKFRNNGFVWAIVWIWLLGIAGSLMRHLWLSLAFGVLVLFIFMPNKNKRGLIRCFINNGLVILSLAAIIFLVINLYPAQINSNYFKVMQNLKQRVASVANVNEDTSAAWRLELWRSAKKVWLTEPVFGVGFGKKISFESEGWQTAEKIRNIHNSPLAIMVQMGVIGLAFFVIFVLLVVVKGLKYIYRDKELMPYYLG